MTIEEILQEEDIKKMMQLLKLRVTPQPVTEVINAQYNPALHDVNNVSKRPNKQVQYGYQEQETVAGEIQLVDKVGIKTELVARIILKLQKVIVNKAVTFAFGNPVKVIADVKGEKPVAVLKTIEKILKDNKTDSHMRRLARSVFSQTEAAEHWFTLNTKEANYDVKAMKKVKVAIFSPERGDTLYPLFDEYGDMIAFSREYNVTQFNKTVSYFETYTDTQILKWAKIGSKPWEPAQGYPKTHTIGKIPVIYARQEETEWQDVQSMIDRLEKLLSNFADTNDYHASPTIVAHGTIEGFAQKGEQGKIVTVEKDGDVKYLSWDKAPESVKLEIDTLLSLIYGLTQTPNITFENVKGIGVVSGVARKFLFMDAHLKVLDKREIFDEFLQRRMNLLKAMVAEIAPDYRLEAGEIELSTEITPYIIDDQASLVTMLTEATGGKAIVSQETATSLAGLSPDAKEEFTKITAEAEQATAFENQNPTV